MEPCAVEQRTAGSLATAEVSPLEVASATAFAEAVELPELIACKGRTR